MHLDSLAITAEVTNRSNRSPALAVSDLTAVPGIHGSTPARIGSGSQFLARRMQRANPSEWAEGLHLTVTGLSKDQRKQVRDVVEAGGGRCGTHRKASLMLRSL